jgi:hypothetical protein
MVSKMFGNVRTLERHAESIVFAMGRVPDDDKGADALQEVFGSGFGEEENFDGFGNETNEILECLKHNAVCFDVFESEDSTRKTRSDMLTLLKALKPIVEQEDIFQVPLTDADVLSLQAIVNEVSERLATSYEVQAFDDVASTLRLLANLEVIKNPVVTAHLEKICEDTYEDIDEIYHAAHMKLLSDPPELEAVVAVRRKLDDFTQSLMLNSFGAPRLEKMTKYIKRKSDEISTLEATMIKRDMEEAERMEERRKAESMREQVRIEAEKRKLVENEKMEAQIRVQEQRVRELADSRDAVRKRAAEKELQQSRAANTARNKPRKKGVLTTIKGWFGW